MAAHAQQLRALVEKFRVDNGRQSYSAAQPSVSGAVVKAPKARAQAAVAGVGGKVKPNGHDHDANAFQEF
jgi:hypothetical protein